jgi:chloramphenicol O-acetyltransferase
MSKTPSEVYQAMNATNILVAILDSQKKISVPLEVFLNASNENKNLNVEYNEDIASFVFELRDKVEQQDADQNVEPESNE